VRDALEAKARSALRARRKPGKVPRGDRGQPTCHAAEPRSGAVSANPAARRIDHRRPATIASQNRAIPAFATTASVDAARSPPVHSWEKPRAVRDRADSDGRDGRTRNGSPSSEIRQPVPRDSLDVSPSTSNQSLLVSEGQDRRSWPLRPWPGVTPPDVDHLGKSAILRPGSARNKAGRMTVRRPDYVHGPARHLRPWRAGGA